MAVSMDKAHAVLSPSSADRWISCPASVGLVQQLDQREEESSYAREGTLAHGLAEIVASAKFGLVSEEQRFADFKAWEKEFHAEKYETGTYEEMYRHAVEYSELLADRMAAFDGPVQLYLEQRMDSGVEGCWGTSDAVLVGETRIEIVDFKYGKGVPVSAEDNFQLRLYGAGALATFGDVLGDTEQIAMTVHQPRLDSVSTEELTAEELRNWIDTVAKPASAEALHGEAPKFGPSLSACRWCPLAGVCKERIASEVGEVFGDILDPEVSPEIKPEGSMDSPEILTPEEMAQILPKLPAIRSWLEAFEAAALETAYAKGIKIPGWKVVKSGGRRSISEPAKAIELLVQAGFQKSKIADTKPKALGALEKVVGKNELPEILGNLLKKSEGRESLVPESDQREAITSVSEAGVEFDLEDLL